MAGKEEMEKEKLPEERQDGVGVKGLSESTKAGLAQYSQGYKPSEAVSQAKSYLQSVMDSAPGAYQSQYGAQIARLYDQIMNRPQFSYDVNKDPLFQQYKNQYMVNGRRAMQDAVGNASALTGGYGNSWGNTAGFQAYQAYLQQLNDKIPELEQYAFGKYQYEGDELRRNMDLTTELDNTDYSRYRDTVSDWQADRAFAGSLYAQERQWDSQEWQAMQDYYADLASLENGDYWQGMNLAEKQRQYDGDLAYKYFSAELDDAYRQSQLQENARQYDRSLLEKQRQYDSDLAYKYYGTGLDEAYRRDAMAQDQRQYESDLAYKYYDTGLDEAYRRDAMAQDQRQYESDLAFQYYGKALDEAYRQAQLAQDQRQYESDLAYRYYDTGLDEAYRRDSLRQNQAQWEAEYALDRDKFDFQVRQYEEALERALSGGAGGPSTAGKEQKETQETALVSPVILKTNAQGSANAGPLAASAPAITQAEWAEMQREMDRLNESSVQKQNQDTAALRQLAEKNGDPSLKVLMLQNARNTVSKKK